jgi:hypothetical protein
VAVARSFGKTKTPPPVLAMGFDKFVERNQNPTAALRNSSAFGSRFRFKLRFTGMKLTSIVREVKCFSARK